MCYVGLKGHGYALINHKVSVAKNRKKIMPPIFFLDTFQQHFTKFLVNVAGKWYSGLGF